MLLLLLLLLLQDLSSNGLIYSCVYDFSSPVCRIHNCFPHTDRKAALLHICIHGFKTDIKPNNSGINNLAYRLCKFESKFAGQHCHQGCQILLLYNIPKWRKIYQVTNWPQNILNGHKIDQMVIKYANIFSC
jgi:hypothetical protein